MYGNLCSSCLFFSKKPYLPYCTKYVIAPPININGRALYPWCVDERTDGLCGPDGKNYIKKDTVQLDTINNEPLFSLVIQQGTIMINENM
jgi:hypothetical protein